MKKELKIVYYKVSEINRAKYNPRSITEESKIGLSASIKEFDLVQPLIINIRRKRNVLVSGHRRLDDLIEKGFTEVPCVEVNLDDKKEELLNVTMNNPKISGFFNDSLGSVLDGLKEMDKALLDSLQITPMMDLMENQDKYFAFMQVNTPNIDYNEVGGGWTSDINKIDKTGESLDGITATIFIECPKEKKDEVASYLENMIIERGFDGVRVR